MDTAAWIVAALLAALFLVTGHTKITQPRLKMAEGRMEWAADVPDGQFRAVGCWSFSGRRARSSPPCSG